MPPKRIYTKKPKVASVPKSTFKRRVAGVVSPAVKSFVARALNRHSENKSVAPITNTGFPVVPMNLGTTGSILNLHNVWTTSQGSGEADRIGNHITPKSWMLRGFVYSNSGGIPCYVKMWVLKLKSGFEAPTTFNDFFDLGNANTNPTGQLLDITRPVNTERYTIYTSRIIKVGGASTGAFIANNDFKLSVPISINLLKYQKHVLKYNDNSSSSPLNSGLYLAFNIAPVDGSVYGAGSTIRFTYDLVGGFEDV